MFQEVSFHPEERRRVKGILKKIGSDYWCVMESSQRVSAGREDYKAGASTKNFEAPWAYAAVVTFLHKDVFKQPTHLDWAAQYSKKQMKHMIQGRMSCLRAPRHSEAPKGPEVKKRRVKQVIACSFPCGKWLHRIGARASPKCELCRREREARGASMDSLPRETVAHIQSAGCNLQKKSVIGAHNRCWKYLIGAISIHGEANRSLEILGGDKDGQLHTLWKETNIGKILPLDDIEEEAEDIIAKEREET